MEFCSMLDRYALKLLRPAIETTARQAWRIGLTADTATLIGFGFGMAAAGLVA